MPTIVDTRKFQNLPVLCWTIDDWQQFNQAIAQQNPNFDLQDYVDRYRRDSYDNNIDILFTGASIKLNLGGETEKSRITTTSRPLGIFDFSLAAQGLYRMQEYYSERLEKEYPNKFSQYELPSGVVPVNLVRDKVEDGVKTFYYEDADGYFPCVKEQKGEAAIRQGVAGAKLKYGTTTKKVYLTFKKNKGKVKYVEIYSIFYYSTPASYSLSGDTEFAIRHIPAIMVAEYLESMGILTRVYMTRFVELEGNYTLREQTDTGTRLPMYDKLQQATSRTSATEELFVQPIIVKEFGQELDKSLAFMVSSASYDEVYQMMARYAQEKEVENSRIKILGNPNFSQGDYFVGIERYRNKYQEYVNLGIFKSKEVLPEAMLFFHDQMIATRLRGFIDGIEPLYESAKNVRVREISEVLVSPEVNPFFSWWMKLSANTLKDKINIINSNELQKDLYLMRSDMEKLLQEKDQIIGEIQDARIKNFITVYANNILQGYLIYNRNNEFTFRQYITEITNEITTYADGELYATDAETRAKRNELVRDVLNIVSALGS